MDHIRFDAITKSFSSHRSRRAILTRAAAGLAAALGTVGLRRGVAAEGATTPAEGESSADDTFLFVQTASSGTFVPNPGASTPAVDGAFLPGDGADYLLTLEGHPGGTVYFSDRPARIFGEAPTQDFLDGLGFTPDNPPNAALVAQTEAGDDVVVLELTNPAYDADAGTIVYGANILYEYDGDGLAHIAFQQEDAQLPERFGRASLFIDDCQDTPNCGVFFQEWGFTGYRVVGPIPGGPYGNCWRLSDFGCVPCRDYGDLDALCNEAYPECNNRCSITQLTS